MLNNNYRKIRLAGFTLIETFVAISILLIAVMGPLQMFSKAIADGLYAKNQTISYYLAQEGIELALYKYNLKPDDFYDSFRDCISDDSCIIYLNELDNIEVSNTDSDFYLNFLNNSYTHEGGIKTIFWRKIYIEEVDDSSVIPEEDSLFSFVNYRLYSEVGWSHFGLSRSFIIERDFIVATVEDEQFN